MAGTMKPAEFLEYQLLKKHEVEFIQCLKDVDLVSLAREAAECKIVPGEVKIKIKSLHPTMPRPLVCRYLLYNVYNSVYATEQEESRHNFDSWLDLLLKVWKATEVSSQVNQWYKIMTKYSSGQPLTSSQIPYLTEALAKFSSAWKEIGTALGLPDNVLKSILAKVHILYPVMCLKEVLSAWVLGKYSTAKPPTLESLQQALHSQTVRLGKEALDELCLYTERPCKKFEIIRQTQNQNIDEYEGFILLEVQVTTDSEDDVTFKWFKNDRELVKNFQVYNYKCHNYHVSIFFLNVRSIRAEGNYKCIIKQNGACLHSAPIAVTVNTPIDKYRPKLIDLYNAQPEVPEDTWPPVPANSTYISLALIKQGSIYHAGDHGHVTNQGDADDSYKDKESQAYEKAFGDLESGARLLIEGHPGSGKSTLVNKISKDWAQNKLIKHVRLLITVHLRAFLSNPKIALCDFLHNFSKESTSFNEISAYAEKHSGLGFCFILDGLDEYLANDNEAYIFQVIKKKFLPNAIVIVTSRPAAAASFRSVANKQIQVIGFLKHQIYEYIKSYPSLNSNKLISYLDQHPDVLHMCYLPIHASMMCFIFKCLDAEHPQTDTALPQTETEIYKVFTQLTILCQDPTLHIPPLDELDEKVQEPYYKVCKLAYVNIKSNKQFIPEDESKSIFNAQDEREFFGLIAVDKVAKLYGIQNICTFHHLIFQEFLAAYYISRLKENEQVDILDQLGVAEQMQQVWKFLCGLVKFNPECKKFKAIIANTKCSTLHKVQCAYESQQPHVCDDVVLDNSLSFQDPFFSASNFKELAYVLSKVNRHIVLQLSFEDCVFDPEGFDIFVKKAEEKLSLLTTFGYIIQSNTSDQLKITNSFLQSLPSLKVLVISNTIFQADKLSVLINNLFELRILRVASEGSISSCILDGTSKSLDYSNVYLSAKDNAPPEAIPFQFHSCWNLTAVKLTEIGIQSLSIDLMRYQSFTRLSFIACGIDDKAASHLSVGLKCCKDLEVLKLSFNSIGDNGAIDIANSVKLSSSLALLDLAHNNLSNRGALALEDIFEASQVKLCLGFNDISKDIFQNNSNIEFHSLDVSNTDLGGTGVDWLSLNCSDNLLHLQLTNSNLSHLGVQCISKLAQSKNLLTLNLSFNALGVDGALTLAGVLKQCVGLQRLDVSSCLLGIDGAKAVANAIKCCTSLLQLKINSNNIRNEGTCAIIEGLKSCRILQDLRVSSNHIQSSGVKALAHAFTHKYWPHLCVLDVSSNDKVGEDIKVLAESLTGSSTLQELYIGNSSMQTNGATFFFNSLSNFKHLKVLNFSCNDFQGSKSVDAIYDSKSLHTLNMKDIGSDWAQADSLHQWANITELNASFFRCSFSDSCLKTLAYSLEHFTRLQILNITSSGLGSAGIEILARGLVHCTQLSKLYIGDNKIEDKGAAKLAHVLMHLKHHIHVLNVSNNSICKSSVLKRVLESSTTLLDLNVSSNSFMDGQNLSNIIQQSRFIRVLTIGSMNLDSNDAKCLARGLKYCANLKALDISSNNIRAVGAEAIAESLKLTRRLNSFNISSNSLEDDGAKAISEGLQVCVNMQMLDISCNDVNSDGAKVIADALKSCRALHTLNISSNNIGTIGAKAFAEALRFCELLRNFDVGSNNIGVEGARAFGQTFKLCTALHVLDVSSNDLKADGAKAIAVILKFSTRLSDFNISFNSLEDDGAKTIAEALKCCVNLQKLDISSNDINVDGAMAIAEGLKFCVNLQTLDISCNSISADGAKAIAGALYKCCTLHALNVSSNNIGTVGADEFAGALKFCNALRVLTVGSNNIGAKGARALGRALRFCKSLHVLDVSSNNLNADGVKAIAEDLKNNSVLRVFKCGSNDLGTGGAEAIAEYLKISKSLHTLDVSANNLGADGATAIAEGLKSCRTLHFLDISCNPGIDDKNNALTGIFDCDHLRELSVANCNCANPFSDAFKHCKKLDKLDISGNWRIPLNFFSHFITTYCKNLAELYVNNCNIEPFKVKSMDSDALANLYLLDISHNPLEDEGVIALASILKKNAKCLCTLYIKSARIGKIGIEALSEALQHSTSLSTLDVCYNLFGSDEAAALKMALTRTKIKCTRELKLRETLQLAGGPARGVVS